MMAEEDMIMARQGELRRLHVIEKVLEGMVKQVEAAEILSLSGRQIRRIVKRIRSEGSRGIIHRSRGRPSNRRISDKMKERVINLYRRGSTKILVRPWPRRSFWREMGFGSMMRPCGCGLLERGTGGRAGDVGDIVNGGSGSSMKERWSRWMVLITIGLKGEGHGVF
jgi:hypothetical protein